MEEVYDPSCAIGRPTAELRSRKAKTKPPAHQRLPAEVARSCSRKVPRQPSGRQPQGCFRVGCLVTTKSLLCRERISSSCSMWPTTILALRDKCGRGARRRPCIRVPGVSQGESDILQYLLRNWGEGNFAEAAGKPQPHRTTRAIVGFGVPSKHFLSGKFSRMVNRERPLNGRRCRFA